MSRSRCVVMLLCAFAAVSLAAPLQTSPPDDERSEILVAHLNEKSTDEPMTSQPGSDETTEIPAESDEADTVASVTKDSADTSETDSVETRESEDNSLLQSIEEDSEDATEKTKEVSKVSEESEVSEEETESPYQPGSVEADVTSFMVKGTEDDSVEATSKIVSDSAETQKPIKTMSEEDSDMKESGVVSDEDKGNISEDKPEAVSDEDSEDMSKALFEEINSDMSDDNNDTVSEDESKETQESDINLKVGSIRMSADSQDVEDSFEHHEGLVDDYNDGDDSASENDDFEDKLKAEAGDEVKEDSEMEGLDDEKEQVDDETETVSNAQSLTNDKEKTTSNKEDGLRYDGSEEKVEDTQEIEESDGNQTGSDTDEDEPNEPDSRLEDIFENDSTEAPTSERDLGDDSTPAAGNQTSNP